MGCFDTVNMPCPKCGEIVREQVKSGDCTLASFSLQDAPAAVLVGLVGEKLECESCGTVFRVKVDFRPTATTYITNEETE